jgi:adenylate kinase family enzyme
LKRVVVQGTSGSGKTTFSSALSARLGVPHIELDALHHGPNWTEATAEELRDRVLAAIDDRDCWVVDGNYERKLGDLVLERADMLVWLDLPLHVCLARLWRRTAHRIHDDVELWNGNKESWRGVLWGRDSLFAWAVRAHVRRRRTFPAHLERFPRLDVVRLRSETKVAAWLDGVTG